MHHIHHTDAFVLKSHSAGEDSKTLVLYTRELGLIYARAQGLRKISSRLRYILQDYSRANIDLVRGKEIWRVTTAAPITSHSSLRRKEESEKIIARLSSLVVRLVNGEEANLEVFAAIERTYGMLDENDLSKEQYRSIELLGVTKVLIALGYLPRTLLEQDEGIPEAFADSAYQHRLIRDINQALSASQL